MQQQLPSPKARSEPAYTRSAVFSYIVATLRTSIDYGTHVPAMGCVRSSSWRETVKLEFGC